MRRRAPVLRILALWLSAGPVVAQGPDPEVASLAFRGNEHFSERQLRRVMTSAPGWFRHPRYHEGTLSSDLNAVLAVYEAQGFLDAQVLEREIRVDEDEVDIVVHLREGVRTRVSSLVIDGAGRIPEAELRRALHLRVGDPFRRQVLLTDARRLENLYSERGMIDTRIGYDAVVDTPGSARLRFRIEEGPPVRVDSVIIRGLDKTRPYVVRRELKLAPEDLFRRSRMAATQTAVFSTGLFRSVVVSPAPGGAGSPRRDLLVTVRERQAGSLDVGVGYGSSERFRAGLALAQTNLRGRGLRVGANASGSRLLRDVEGVFTVPYILDRHVALDGRLFHKWERNPGAAFRTQTTGTEATFSYAWRNSWVSKVSYALQRVRFRTDDIELYQPARTTSSLSIGLRRDSRDNPLDTRAGSLVRTRIDVAGGLLGGDRRFNRSTVELTHFRRLWGPVLAVHAMAQGIVAGGVERRLAAYEQFYLGGDRSVRGYGRGEIGADRVGELALNAQLELRLPVRGHGLVLFRDVGQVWTDVADVDLPGDLRTASGLGLRYNSRFGLLRFDVALADSDEDLIGRLGFYLGVGQAF